MTNDEAKAAINWREFDEFPENEVECQCGAIFRAHAKMVSAGNRLVLFTRKPCPACGADESPRRVTSEPEHQVIRR